MAIQREFLGWDGPCLPRAAGWLIDKFGRPGACDLGGLIVVTPGGRAGRRLLEILVEQAGARPFSPPMMTTPGSLPESLYPADSARPASPLRLLLARAAVLRQAGRQNLSRLVTHPPEDDDPIGWLTLARQIDDLAAQLAAEGLRVDEVIGLAEQLPDFPDDERWRLLSELQGDYEAMLARDGVQDLHAARAQAVRDRRCATDKQVILLAAVDLSRLVRQMLEQVAERVTALIHAPANQAAAFDEFGCADVDHWAGATLDLPEQNLTVVDRPEDQARAVVAALAELGPSVSPDQATVGLGDAKLGAMVQRAIELAGAPARLAAGLPLSRTRPVTLLAALARLLARRDITELAAVLRHPDVETFLQGKFPAATSWLAMMDRYAQDHLPHRLDGRWLGGAQQAMPLADLEKAVMELAGPPDWGTPRPLPHWSESIASRLAEVYGVRPLDRLDPQDAVFIRTLHLIAGALAEQSHLSPEHPATPRVTCAQAIQVALAQLADQAVPPEAGDPAVELLGWLELELDDAPHLIVTGFNEGSIPSSVNSDWILPDHLRRVLGLMDNRRRYARDMMMLTAILRSRPGVRFIAGRFDAEGAPLSPSRLALARDAAELPAWVERFYPSHPAPAVAAAPLLAPGGLSAFHVPAPQAEREIPERLPVTAFRDYLLCPYRFYLKHVLKLATVDDAATELSSATFGSVAHRVLLAFGQSDLAGSADADEIERFLDRRLEEEIAEGFGRRPAAAVVIQREFLRQRLARLARWQAEQAEAGWRIVPEWLEVEAEATLTVDGQPFVIYGRIDRFDAHPEFGHRILDYKTGDVARGPDERHRSSGEWIDLQLPLYAKLAEGLGVHGGLSLGYLQLPKDLAKIGFDEAPWERDVLGSALEKAVEVIRLIRRRQFTPRFPAMYEDEFSGICMDNVLDRTHALDLFNRAGAAR